MDVNRIKKDFPILEKEVNGKKIVYLDNAATSQKPRQVIEAMDELYYEYNANVHRGIYRFSEQATEKYENAREKLKRFINSKEEVIFTKNASEALNLIAYSWGEENVRKGDRIVLTVMEHHSNLVPWQQLAKRKKAKLEFMDIGDDYEIKESELDKIRGAKIVAVCHVSNVLGTINPVKEICELANETGAISVVDGAQSTPHMKVDVSRMKCDFFALTGHKMLGPTGIGALHGNRELLEKMPPFMAGGDMVVEVYQDRSVWNGLPHKFEAGTPNIAGTIGLGAAVDYLSKIGMDEIRKHEIEITKYAIQRLEGLSGVSLYGTKRMERRAGIIPFNVKGVHPHDVATLLDEEGIAIRSGHHCAMPLHTRLGLDATNRASFYIYNDRKDVDKLAEAIENAKKIFSEPPATQR